MLEKENSILTFINRCDNSTAIMEYLSIILLYIDQLYIDLCLGYVI